MLDNAQQHGETRYYEPVSRILIVLLLESEKYKEAIAKIDVLPSSIQESKQFRLAKAYALYHLDDLTQALALLDKDDKEDDTRYLIAQIVHSLFLTCKPNGSVSNKSCTSKKTLTKQP